MPRAVSTRQQQEQRQRPQPQPPQPQTEAFVIDKALIKEYIEFEGFGRRLRTEIITALLHIAGGYMTPANAIATTLPALPDQAFVLFLIRQFLSIHKLFLTESVMTNEVPRPNQMELDVMRAIVRSMETIPAGEVWNRPDVPLLQDIFATFYGEDEEEEVVAEAKVVDEPQVSLEMEGARALPKLPYVIRPPGKTMMDVPAPPAASPPVQRLDDSTGRRQQREAYLRAQVADLEPVDEYRPPRPRSPPPGQMPTLRTQAPPSPQQPDNSVNYFHSAARERMEALRQRPTQHQLGELSYRKRWDEMPAPRGDCPLTQKAEQPTSSQNQVGLSPRSRKILEETPGPSRPYVEDDDFSSSS